MYEFEKSKLYSYLGDELVDLLKRHKCYIAGGTITSLFCNRDINDIDVYFRDEQSLIDFLYDAWSDNHHVIANTKKATLILYKVGHDNINLQLVHFRYFDNATDIFDTFDFTVCMGCFDFSDESFVLDNCFMQHNSQRILKFNRSTAFPIVSLLRVQKYKDKRYTISKPEFIRIVLACMSLNITSYAQLKEHLGGMYGINYDKLFVDVDDNNFSLDVAIDKISDLHLDDEYFKHPTPLKFDDVEDVIDNITNKQPKYFKIDKYTYKIKHDGTMKCISGGIFTSTHPEPHISSDAVWIDAREHMESIKFYKFVQKRDGRYYSFFDNSFEYIIDESVAAKNQYLYMNELREIRHSSYSSSEGKVLIEISVEFEDFIKKDGDTIYVKRCTPIRVVDEIEYKQYI